MHHQGQEFCGSSVPHDEERAPRWRSAAVRAGHSRGHVLPRSTAAGGQGAPWGPRPSLRTRRRLDEPGARPGGPAQMPEAVRKPRSRPCFSCAGDRVDGQPLPACPPLSPGDGRPPMRKLQVRTRHGRPSYRSQHSHSARQDHIPDRHAGCADLADGLAPSRAAAPDDLCRWNVIDRGPAAGSPAMSEGELCRPAQLAPESCLPRWPASGAAGVAAHLELRLAGANSTRSFVRSSMGAPFPGALVQCPGSI